jgi:hypothetical protein
LASKILSNPKASFNTSKYQGRLEKQFRLSRRATEQSDLTYCTLQIEPKAGVIATKSKQSFTVKMTPQAARAFKERLLVDLVGVRDGALELPITATCSVPQVRKQIWFTFLCYANVTNTKSMTTAYRNKSSRRGHTVLISFHHLQRAGIWDSPQVSNLLN